MRKFNGGKGFTKRRNRITYIWIFIGYTALVLNITSCMSPDNNVVKFGDTQTISPDHIISMVWQNSRYLWINTNNGVVRWDISRNVLEDFKEIDNCYLNITHNPEIIWCDANYYEDNSWHKVDLNLYQIVQASDGILWAGSEKGLLQLDHDTQTWRLILRTIPPTPEPYVTGLSSGIHLSLISNDNYLWFVSNDIHYNGTTRWKENLSQTFSLKEWGNSYLIPKLEASDGSIWGGGNDGLVAQWNGDNWQTWHLAFENRLPEISEVVESENGDIWVRPSVGGVAKWNGEEWRIWERRSGIGNPSVQTRLKTSSIIVHNGQIWLSTSQEGISRWDGNRWRNYTMTDGLSSDAITVLTESPDGVLWAGTWGGGVNYYSSGDDRWHSFPDNQ